jgi:hypothetical protein
MKSLFFKLTSGQPVLRKMITDSSSEKAIWIQILDSRFNEVNERERLWKLLQDLHNQQLVRKSLYNTTESIRRYYINTNVDCYTIEYISREWKPITSYREELDSRIGSSKLLNITHEREIGLKNLRLEIPRIKAFLLIDAIKYSLKNDIRFCITLCAILGLSMWWGIAPEPLFLKPEVLISPDIHTLYTAAKDTFINNVCTTHPLISSPCPCGEPINNEARILLDNNNFDPLGIEK